MFEIIIWWGFGFLSGCAVCSLIWLEVYRNVRRDMRTQDLRGVRWWDTITGFGDHQLRSKHDIKERRNGK